MTNSVGLALQSVVFGTDPAALHRTARAAARAVATLRRVRPELGRVEWRLADCTEPAMLGDSLVESLRLSISAVDPRTELALLPLPLHRNLGPSAAHNLLWARFGPAELLFLMAPDLVPHEESLVLLAAELDDPRVGAASARRLPVEPRPLGADLTGDSLRVGGARSLVRGQAWQQIGGHEEAFFLYGNDHHLSARLIEAGWKLRYQPAAIAFHDNRPDSRGVEPPTAARRYYSALGQLILLHTWSAHRALGALRARLESARDTHRRRALTDFEVLERESRLPTPRSHPLVTPVLDSVEASPGHKTRPLRSTLDPAVSVATRLSAGALPADQLVVRIIGDDPVGRRDTLLCLSAQTAAVQLANWRGWGARWRLDLRAGDLLIADAVERLLVALGNCQAAAVEVPVLVQAIQHTRISAVDGRRRVGTLNPPDAGDRRVIVRRRWALPVRPRRLASLGERPLVVISREAE